jgi:hypothetical protein
MGRTCPKGHVTQTVDYCDQCGTPMESPSGGQSAEAKPSAAASTAFHTADLVTSPDTAPCSPAEPCPRCQTPRVGSDKFCEGCGYNFATGDSLSPDLAISPSSEPA